ncbi:DedA family protein [Micrococcales bacterium 31B]|nr:DedA family protein [Micrococcales bacterium 31B]
MDFLNRLLHIFDGINGAIVHAANAWWAMPLTGFFIVCDAFFPVVPSESLMVSFASLTRQTGSGVEVNLWLLFVVGGLAAALGDNISYFIGRAVGVERFRFTREGKGRRAIEFARKHLNRRATVLILTARYIPFGRTAVTMTAGATGFDWRRFLGLSILAGFSWSGYSIAIGTIASSWVHGNPLLGIVIALVFAALLSVIVDRIIAAAHRWHDAREASHHADDA